MKAKWLEAVKIYGNKPNTLFTKMKVNNESKNQVVPGFIEILRILENSKCRIRKYNVS